MDIVSRVINNDEDLSLLFKFLSYRIKPYTVRILEGVKRSNKQNKLQRQIISIVQSQLNDQSKEEIRAYIKLHFGVPILRNDDDEFKSKYDSTLLNLSYEQKLLCMSVPLDFPVTRIMTVNQKTRFLDDVIKYYSERGIDFSILNKKRKI